MHKIELSGLICKHSFCRQADIDHFEFWNDFSDYFSYRKKFQRIDNETEVSGIILKFGIKP